MRRSRRASAFVAIAVFVVADAVLIVAAFANVHGTSPHTSDHSATTRGANGPSSNDGPNPTSTADTANSADAARSAQGPTESLAAHGSRVARFTGSQCAEHGRAGLQLSTNAGKSFDEISLPLEDQRDDRGKRPVAVTSILAVDVSDPDSITVIGTDVACDVHAFTTSDDGRTWKQGRPGQWFVDETTLHAPNGPADPGCTAMSVWSTSNEHAQVVCTGGTIVGTDDGGTEWVRLGVLPELTAGSFTGVRDGIAAATTRTCAARAYTTADAGGSWHAAGCIDKKHEATFMVATDEHAYVLVDGIVKRSSDQGRTWREPSQ